MVRASLPADWATSADETLLDFRLADLPLSVEGTLAERVELLRSELRSRGLEVPLHVYLSDEWFTPDGGTTMAIPFYLAHPRLERLENSQMYEVEGGEHEWCMRILRHEAGHVIDNAFKLRRRRQRREVFGSPSVPYPDSYTPKPYSKSFVLHLDAWYAQSHPDEDFAETFAVWLTPNSEWRQRYAGWPALKKLEYMDSLMRSIAGHRAPLENGEEIDPLRSLRKTLRQHYKNKRRHYGLDRPNFYDRDLRRLFSAAPEFADRPTAAQFLSRIKVPVRRVVASWTGIYQYTIERVIEDMIIRSRELRLRLAVPEEQARQEFTVLLTVQAMNYLHSGGHRLYL
ncbi:MAG: hypothetical protein HOP14_15185 [Acidobacteria bacterium]|nr:hypothetical protein [Acidobacteriota bacterium]